MLQPQTVTDGPPWYLQVERIGDMWTVRYSTDGQAWSTAGSFTVPLALTAAGPFAANTGDPVPAHTAIVDYFYDTVAPGVGDVEQNVLAVGTIGNGTVVPNPDLANYACGQVVELTAVPDVGWAFTDWSGDVVSTTNPVDLTITGDHFVTAAFTTTTVTYTLAVNTVGNGAVTVDPDKPAYVSGELVTLTATADPGWVLSGWSGDLSGTANPATLVMTADKVVTATFVAPPVVSDDFNSCTLDSDLWTFVDPLGDGSLSMNGTQVLLHVPGGVAHGVGPTGHFGPRIMRLVADEDFEVEVKFDSGLSQHSSNRASCLSRTAPPSCRCISSATVLTQVCTRRALPVAARPPCCSRKR